MAAIQKLVGMTETIKETGCGLASTFSKLRMKGIPVAPDELETARLALLRSLDILDTKESDSFDRITSLVRTAFGVCPSLLLRALMTPAFIIAVSCFHFVCTRVGNRVTSSSIVIHYICGLSHTHYRCPLPLSASWTLIGSGSCPTSHCTTQRVCTVLRSNFLLEATVHIMRFTNVSSGNSH